jgi:riboflavin synthase
MFTGIVQRRGTVVDCDVRHSYGRIIVEGGAWDPPIQIGESVAVSGTCLTVRELWRTAMVFDVLHETLRRTNLGLRRPGDPVNLERALRWGDPLGGHIVIGHVDGTGVVRAIEPVGRDWRFEITCGPDLMDGMVYKGSVAVDGVSLTIADLSDDAFGVHIIPHTYEVTCFGAYRVGDVVNIEVDVLAKFVRRLLERGRMFKGVTWEELRREGLWPVSEDVPDAPRPTGPGVDGDPRSA